MSWNVVQANGLSFLFFALLLVRIRSGWKEKWEYGSRCVSLPVSSRGLNSQVSEESTHFLIFNLKLNAPVYCAKYSVLATGVKAAHGPPVKDTVVSKW